MNVTRPKVSVLMLTYNHAAYVRQAIESVLTQKTTYPYEVLVADDCSTDGTQSIIRQLATQRPDVVRPILREANVGVKQNFRDALQQCCGEYVAILEGDDYWIDEYKLQKQIDFLEYNREYVLVGANALCISEHDNFASASLAKSGVVDSFDFSTPDLIERNPLPTLTVVFRNHVVQDFPLEYFTSSIGGDRIIYILLSQHGKCRFMNQVFGVYRVHEGGVTDVYRNSTNGQLRRLEDLFLFAEQLHAFLNGQYERETMAARAKAASDIFAVALKSGRIVTAFRYAQYLDHSVFQNKLAHIVARCAKRVSAMLDLPVNRSARRDATRCVR